MDENTLMKAALEEAESELCYVGHSLVHEGYDTATIALALDLVRIALWGGNGDGKGPEHFEAIQAALKAKREEEGYGEKLERTCVACGCTDSRACPEGCHWVWLSTEKPVGICSVCAPAFGAWAVGAKSHG
ncbi:hypothetical protein [Methylogaea oryzae]|uniref:Uncharacterized protein n=1 Tax=Methylogaea oryzae TaxID=1295382 RepID=A0A8D5AL19_9GAMM|nr:hypothetical protein [Methylogaea oryzae]BBL69720.1 hypothetical protein MoryE10_03260 [Methylogaea oryzae]